MCNAFGLKREIPAATKRLIRQRCGFGCVICGLGIVQYEHVDPEFKNAKEHDPEAMALLCPGCHNKVTTGMWSKSRVKLAMRNPKCLEVGYSREFFDSFQNHPALRFGGVLLKNCQTPIQVGGYPLISIKPPEGPGAPFLFSGTFTDSKGEVTLVIEDNEWKAYTRSWDVQVLGPRITIREGHRKIHLVLKANPPDELVVERLSMLLAGMKFEANGDLLRVTMPNGVQNDFTYCVADNCQVGMAF